MSFLSELNSEQREAVEYNDGPLAVVAGPGTGKTKTLASKIVYLLEEKKVPAADIAAVTFTKKATEELRQRVQDYCGEKIVLPFIGTIHALAYEVLKQEGRELIIISEEEQLDVARKLRKHPKLDKAFQGANARDLLLLITRYKSEPAANHGSTSAISRLGVLYNAQLEARGVHDYDDILLEALAVASPQYEYVFVDEFQDTNGVQYELLKRLSRGHMTVIGDPLQSIYGFRGASSDIFNRFQQDFLNCREYVLVKQYRSGRRLFEASHALFPESVVLKTVAAQPGEVAIVATENEHTEARWIGREIAARMGGMDLNEVRAGENGQLRFSDFAIMYRTHDAGRVVAETLAEAGIPYYVVGEVSPYEDVYIQADKVTLLTMHAAKGLEFSHVFVCGCEEGLIPYTKKALDPFFEEEKRLLYVAMTRAKQALFLLTTQWRYRRVAVPSRFLALLPDSVKRFEDPGVALRHKKRAKTRERRSQLRLL